MNFSDMNSIAPYPFWVRIKLPHTALYHLRYVQNSLNNFLYTSSNPLNNFPLTSLCLYLLHGYDIVDRHYCNSFFTSSNTLLKSVLNFLPTWTGILPSFLRYFSSWTLYLPFIVHINTPFLKVNKPWSSGCPLDIISDNLRPNIS